MITVTQTELYAHVCSGVHGAKLSAYPFTHISMRNFLPQFLYGRLINSLPAPELYAPLSNTRAQFVFTPENQAKLPADTVGVWMDLLKVFNEIGFKQTMFNKMAEGLKHRFGDKTLDDIDCDMDIRLMRDTAGYGILPHCDTMKKIITMQIYLPATDRHMDCGTIMYKKDVVADGEEYIEVVRFPFIPNFSYAFVVNNKEPHQSWHGVEDLPLDFPGARNSLLVMFNAVGGK